MSTTKTRTGTWSHTDAKHVNWKIRSDLQRLQALYGNRINRLTKEYVEDLSADLYLWVHSGNAAAIRFNFYDADSSERRFAIHYDIARDGTVTTDDDPGGLGYHDLEGISFRTNVTYSDDFKALTPEEQDEFRATLELSWGPTSNSLTDGDGHWTTDRNYSSNDLGARRKVFRPN